MKQTDSVGDGTPPFGAASSISGSCPTKISRARDCCTNTLFVRDLYDLCFGGLRIAFRLRAGARALCRPILQGLLQISPRPVGGRLDLSAEAIFCCDEICCQVITESLWKGFMMDRRSAPPFLACRSRWDSPERTVPRSFSESSRPFPERLPLLRSGPHFPPSSREIQRKPHQRDCQQ